uniref:CSON010196 protein n=1 Tax=Culicoides sonorensis TaxID=179676 RepID=A0A336KAP4_CULSO
MCEAWINGGIFDLLAKTSVNDWLPPNNHQIKGNKVLGKRKSVSMRLFVGQQNKLASLKVNCIVGLSAIQKISFSQQFLLLLLLLSLHIISFMFVWALADLNYRNLTEFHFSSIAIQSSLLSG